MADPRPPRDGAGAFVDVTKRLERRVRELSSPSGTARANATDQITATVEYLSQLKSYGSTGGLSATLANMAADGVTRYYWVGPSPDGPLTGNSHYVKGIQVPTGKLMVTASVGESSVTPQGGFMIGYVTFRVSDAADATVWATGRSSGRLYTNQRFGAGLSTGTVLVPVDLAKYQAPFNVALYVGYWAQTTNTAPVSLVFNTPALRVEVVDAATT